MTKRNYNAPLLILWLTGNTYPIKEELKADGFRWDSHSKAWAKNFWLDEPGICYEYVKNLAYAFEGNGVIAEITGDIPE